MPVLETSIFRLLNRISLITDLQLQRPNSTHFSISPLKPYSKVNSLSCHQSIGFLLVVTSRGISEHSWSKWGNHTFTQSHQPLLIVNRFFTPHLDLKETWSITSCFWHSSVLPETSSSFLGSLTSSCPHTCTLTNQYLPKEIIANCPKLRSWGPD